MLVGVICTGGRDGLGGETIHLEFSTEDALEDALVMWSNITSFAVVTAHHTCNLPDERGAW